ncbi:MAG: tRNA (N6-threonylcarbamoyladenosine(37)-N6)-methyltransferase TrmO [Thermoprotei archaeon]
MNEIILKPIGVVRTSASDDVVRNSLTGVEGYIEIYPEYSVGLDGIEGFSHIIVIAYLHKTSEDHRKVLRVKHRKLVRLGLVSLNELPEVGVFATDSPHRPNPIALTIVELIERRGNILYVKGLDLFDGTPVLDIKPYTPDRIIENPRVPEWYMRIYKKIREKLGLDLPL